MRPPIAETLDLPNPTTDLVVLPAVAGRAQYRLFDALGRPVLQGPATRSTSARCPAAPSGWS